MQNEIRSCDCILCKEYEGLHPEDIDANIKLDFQESVEKLFGMWEDQYSPMYSWQDDE